MFPIASLVFFNFNTQNKGKKIQVDFQYSVVEKGINVNSGLNKKCGLYFASLRCPNYIHLN